MISQKLKLFYTSHSNKDIFKGGGEFFGGTNSPGYHLKWLVDPLFYY